MRATIHNFGPKSYTVIVWPTENGSGHYLNKDLTVLGSSESYSFRSYREAMQAVKKLFPNVYREKFPKFTHGEICLMIPKKDLKRTSRAFSQSLAHWVSQFH